MRWKKKKEVEPSPRPQPAVLYTPPKINRAEIERESSFLADL